jgi:hypothetical protein
MKIKNIPTMTNQEVCKEIATIKGIHFRVSDGNMDFICGDRLHRDYANSGDLIGRYIDNNNGKTYSYEDLLPNWAEDISDSMSLADEVDGNICFELRINNILMSDERYMALFWSSDPRINRPAYVATAKTIPLAICRAWLMWKREELVSCGDLKKCAGCGCLMDEVASIAVLPDGFKSYFCPECSE